MSRLTDKVSSYNHFKGISFDEASYTLTPTRTGSASPYNEMLDALFVAGGTVSPSVVNGPMPGQNAYKFTFDFANNKSTRLYYGSTSSGSAGGLTDIRRAFWDGTPFDRVMGFWFKIPATGTVPTGINFGVMRLINGTSPLISFNIATDSGNPKLGLTTVNEFNSTILDSTQYGNSTDGFKSFEWNKWYFIGIRKEMTITIGGTVNSSASGTLKYTLYINGIESGSATTSSWTYRSISAIEFGRPGAGAAGLVYDVTFANWFMAEWSDIGQQALKDIYLYGSPTNRDFQNADIKYYDGSTWNSSTNEKVYHSGAWQDVYASRWNGSAWIPL